MRPWQSLAPEDEVPIRHWMPRPVEWLPRDFMLAFNKLCAGELPWPLLIYGPAGTSKTTCGLAACDRACPVYWPMPELVQHQAMINARTKSGVYYHEDPWPGIIEAPFAVLDEIGVRGVDPNIEYQVLLKFLEERQRHNRVAIYITNIHPQQLAAAFDARIEDRLTCGTLLELKGDSKRWQE